MKNNRTDNDLNKLFETYQPEVDTDMVWENIEPKLKKKKKNRFFFFWLLLGLGLVGVFFGLKKETPILVKELQSTESQEITPTTEITNLAEIEKIEESTTIFTGTKKVNSIIKKEPFFVEAAQTFPLKKEIVSSPIFKRKEKTNIEKTAPKTTEGTVSNNSPVAPQSISTNKENLTGKVDESQFNTEKKGVEIVKKTTGAEKIQKEKPVGTLEKVAIKKSKKRKKKKRKKKKRKRKKINRMANTKWRPYIQTFLAPEYAIKSLRFNGSPESTLISMRKSTESPLETYSIGANLQMVHKQGLVLFSGFEYRIINEKYQRTEETERTALENGIISYTVNSAGDTIDVGYGLKMKTTTTKTEETAYNYHQFINLPIGIGYRKMGRKSGWKILGGLNINLWYDMNATLLNGTGRVGTYNNTPNQLITKAFKSKAGINFWSSFEYFRKINGNVHWMIAPKIEIPTSSLTNDIYPLSQRYFNLSLKTGFNFLLAKAPKKKKKRKKKVRK